MELRKIDIPYFEDEYGYNVLNCVETPIALATSFYHKEYYYMYGTLKTIEYNWSKKCNDDFIMMTREILTMMGIAFVDHEIKSFEQLKEFVLEHVGTAPIYLAVKYQYLYYHKSYFVPKDYATTHGLLITGYEPDLKMFIIRDRATSSVAGTIEIQVPEMMLKYIWENSNERFIENNEEWKNRAFYIDQVSNYNYTWDKVFEEMVQNYTYENNNLYQLIESNQIFGVIQLGNKYVLNMFSTSLGMLFHGMEIGFENSLADQSVNEKFVLMRNRYIAYRNQLTLKLTKLGIIKRNLDKEFVENTRRELKELDIDLFCLIRELFESEKKQREQEIQYRLPLDEYCNNLAFDTQLSMDSKAVLNENGTYLLKRPDELIGTLTVKQYVYQLANANEIGYDNISCNAQRIELPESGPFHVVRMLGCTTLNGYSGTLIVNYKDGSHEQVEISFSDFSHIPSYQEEIAWCGKGIKRNKEKKVLAVLTNRACIFEQVYKLRKRAEIRNFVLPLNYNMHIFAITLV